MSIITVIIVEQFYGIPPMFLANFSCEKHRLATQKIFTKCVGSANTV